MQGHDAVRAEFEIGWLAKRLPRLLAEAGAPEVLDLGCGGGAVAELAGTRLRRYLGVDLAPSRSGAGRAEFLGHDLRDGLGPVGTRPFALYIGTFGIASHLSPAELGRLLREIASHARPGALVALEALGLRSLEWPRLWETPPGRERTIEYRMATDVHVHPWAPEELAPLFEEAGIRPLRVEDRTVQAGPKLSGSRYWPGLPDVRAGLNALLNGERDAPALRAAVAPLPPLPAGSTARVHHTLARRRSQLAVTGRLSASAVWDLEPATAGGYGHGLFVVGRVLG
jgi:SAM-dependent methyltransferase